MKLTPQDVQVINQELSRQTHFRGYFATNDEILALQDSAMGDYAYSAEDLLCGGQHVVQSWRPLAAAVAFTNGTFTLLGSTFNGCQCVALEYTLDVP
ncbi:MAG: hypothetical protein EZS28_048919, partial [Streblomastix strix]